HRARHAGAARAHDVEPPGVQLLRRRPVARAQVAAQGLDLARLRLQPRLERAEAVAIAGRGGVAGLLGARRWRQRGQQRRRQEARPCAPGTAPHGAPTPPWPARARASPKFIACSRPRPLLAASIVVETWICTPSSVFWMTSPAPGPLPGS